MDASTGPDGIAIGSDDTARVPTASAPTASAEVIAEASKTEPRPLWQTVARAVVTLGLVAWLLYAIDLGETARLLEGADPWLIAVAFLLFLASRYVSALRWWLLLRGRHPSVTYRAMSRLILTSSFLGYFLPGGGTDALRMIAVARAISDLPLVVASMAVERVTGLIGLLVTVIVAIWLTPLPMPSWIEPVAEASLVAMIVGTVIVMLEWPRRILHAALNAVRMPALSRLAGKLLDGLDSYRDRPWLVVAALLIGLGFQLLFALPVALIGLAIGLDVPIAYYVAIVPVVRLLISIPISIGGFGLREGAYVYLLGLAGASPSAALVTSILALTLFLLSVLPGAWVYLRHGMGIGPR